jgi:hypothetical protein
VAVLEHMMGMSSVKPWQTHGFEQIFTCFSRLRCRFKEEVAVLERMMGMSSVKPWQTHGFELIFTCFSRLRCRL